MIFEKQVVNSYKSMIYTRCDDTQTVFYFSADDFNGLKKEKYFVKKRAKLRFSRCFALFHYSLLPKRFRKDG